MTTVVPEALTAFAAANTAMGAATAVAGTADAAAQGAVMAGVFGLIGQEFLLAFTAAQGTHLASVAQLAAVQAATGAAATGGLASFVGADAGAAAGIAR